MEHTFYAPPMEHPQIDGPMVVRLCSRILRMCDPRLVDHGNRTAWIALRIREQLPPERRPDEKRLLLLCLLHDVGAYKTEEIDRMTEFESRSVQAHSVYGYLFLKYFTPLGADSEAILYHHLPHRRFAKLNCDRQIYAELIQLADRTDMALQNGWTWERVRKSIHTTRFSPELAAALERAAEGSPLLEELRENTCPARLDARLDRMAIPGEEAVAFLKMIIHTIDFKSKFTRVHSVNTTIISIELAEMLELPADETERIYYAAMVHDIGKMAIPEEILEYPGRLNPEQILLMRRHVEYTETALRGIFPAEIVDLAARHHEKLDGSGYPRGLTASELTVGQRIIAVAGIFSALTSQRSYKDAFSRDLTLSILREMAQQGQLDARVTAAACGGYDRITEEIDRTTAPIIDRYHDIQEEYARLTQSRILRE